MSRRLSWELRPREALDGAEVDAMRELLHRHFLGVERERFAQDLGAKDQVILLRDEAGALVGFSTLCSEEQRVEERRVSVLFSGDTVVDRQAWGSPALAQGWLSAALAIKGQLPEQPLYWLLIAGGFRTYRFLPLFFKEFWPRHDARPPAPTRRLIEGLARARFGKRYADGVVTLEGPTPVRPELAAVPPSRLNNPHIAFFVRANPGHVDGDELVCLTEVAEHNLTAAGHRVLRAVQPPGLSKRQTT